jgi:hypothetical protein
MRVFIIEALHPTRLKRLRAVAKHGRAQGALSKEFKKQADSSDKKWWKHAIKGGDVSVLHDKGVTKAKSDPYGSREHERKQHQRKRKMAGMRTMDMDRKAGKASVRSFRARDIVKAYGHPKRLSRMKAKHGLALSKTLATGGNTSSRFKAFSKADERRKAQLAAQPAASKQRKARIAKIAARGHAAADKHVQTVLQHRKSDPKTVKTMNKARRIVKRRQDQSRYLPSEAVLERKKIYLRGRLLRNFKTRMRNRVGRGGRPRPREVSSRLRFLRGMSQ